MLTSLVPKILMSQLAPTAPSCENGTQGLQPAEHGCPVNWSIVVWYPGLTLSRYMFTMFFFFLFEWLNRVSLCGHDYLEHP